MALECNPALESRIEPFQNKRHDSLALVKTRPSRQWLSLQLSNSALPLSIISTDPHIRLKEVGSHSDGGRGGSSGQTLVPLAGTSPAKSAFA